VRDDDGSGGESTDKGDLTSMSLLLLLLSLNARSGVVFSNRTNCIRARGLRRECVIVVRIVVSWS